MQRLLKLEVMSTPFAALFPHPDMFNNYKKYIIAKNPTLGIWTQDLLPPKVTPVDQQANQKGTFVVCS